MKNRIWELDALRGLCVIGMVGVHLVVDLCMLYSIIQWNIPPWFAFVQNWGGVLFLLISGISATLGRRSFHRGLVVFGCGLLITAVTAGMYFFRMASAAIIIYFGVLQCLGVCMMLWPLFRRLPWWALTALGLAMVALGLWLVGLPHVDTWLLIPFGLRAKTFLSGDYFPLFPNLGFFLLGAALGRTLYRQKTSLLLRVNAHAAPLRFLQWVGKHSLFIYLAHQPILTAFCMLLAALM